MDKTPFFSYHYIATLLGLILVFLSLLSTTIFHFKGWHQMMEKILWGSERISLGFKYNTMKMGQWTAYCIFPFAARRAGVEREMAYVPLPLKICIHCSFWFSLTGFSLLIYTESYLH